MEKELQKLTLKQERFVDNYIANGGNGTQAAIEAGYSENCATVIATENLRKPNVVQSMAERKKKAAEAAGWSPEFVFQKLMQWATDPDYVPSLKAIDMAAKYSGMSTEELNVNVRRHEDWLEKLMEKEIVSEK